MSIMDRITKRFDKKLTRDEALRVISIGIPVTLVAIILLTLCVRACSTAILWM